MTFVLKTVNLWHYIYKNAPVRAYNLPLSTIMNRLLSRFVLRPSIVLLTLLCCVLSPQTARADMKNAQNYLKLVTYQSDMPHGVDTISALRPYIEFEVLFQDFYGINDCSRNIEFNVVNKGEEVLIYHYGRGKDHQNTCVLYNTDWGLVEYLGHRDKGDLEIGKYRFYPSSKALQEGFKGLHITGGWDIDGKNRISYNVEKTFYITVLSPQAHCTVARAESHSVKFQYASADNPDWSQHLRDMYALKCFTDNGWQVEYAVKDATQKEVLAQDTRSDATHIRLMDQDFPNNEEVVLTAQLVLRKSITVKNAKGEEQTISQDFTLPVEEMTLEPMVTPSNVRCETNLWNKTITISWEKLKKAPNYKAKWYIYRRLQSQSEDMAVKVAECEWNKYTFTDTDAALDYDTRYVYDIDLVPDGWQHDEPIRDLSTTIEASIKRIFDIKLTATGQEDKIDLAWTHAPIKLSGNYVFSVESHTGDGNWSEVGSVRVRSTSATDHAFTHKDITSSCDTYHYRVAITMLDQTFYSTEANAQIYGTSHIISLTASKGAYAGAVKLNWKAEQHGSAATEYNVYRRPLGSAADWRPIYSTSGTASNYSYDDTNVAVGGYYEYKVTSSTVCGEAGAEGRPTGETSLLDDGFCQAAGSIGGQVTYGAGNSAVAGVKVSLQKNDDNDLTPLLYSLHVGDETGGVVIDDASHPIVEAAQPFAVQMWVSPSLADTVSSPVGLINIPNVLSLSLVPADTTYTFAVGTYAMGGRAASVNRLADTFAIPKGVYSHIAFSYDGRGRYTLYRVEDFQTVDSIAGEIALTGAPAISSVRFAAPVTTEAYEYNGMTGYIDDVRLWSKTLSAKDLLTSYDHLLSGQENDLLIYLPFDEGISSPVHAYDYSTTDGVPNNRHGAVYSGTQDPYVPDALGIYGLTDSSGNYLIRGIPFSKGGTNYTLLPTMGIHEFSPAQINRFVSETSINHNGVNFTDKSSFPVSGSVFYEGTTIPVAEANLYVDGQPCSRDGKLLQTDADGNFDIDVPIGEHFIEVRKDYHTFSGNGYWPAQVDSTIVEKHYFDQALSGLHFYDQTLVPVVGRVCGGEKQDSLIVGCGASINNIGVTELVLSVGNYKLNVTRDEFGTAFDATTPRTFAIPEENQHYTHSTAAVGAGSAEATRKLRIVTDSITGEFVAMLPPCEYKVESVRLLHPHDGIEFVDNPHLDATSVGTVQADSLDIGDEIRTIRYVTSYKRMYQADATITMQDVTNADGAFGEPEYDVANDLTGDVTTVHLYEVSDDGKVDYTYGYPIFRIGSEYEFEIHASERYFNHDSGEPVLYEDPLVGATVNVVNEFCGQQLVLKETGGLTDEIFAEDMQLDSLGNVRYRFVVGYPNIVKPYTRGLTMTVKSGDFTTEWDQNGQFNVIVFGGLPTGNNFLTDGPTIPLMVLRDPPGAGSSTTLSEGTTFNVKRNTNTTTKWGGRGAEDIYIGPDVATAFGYGLLMLDSKQAKSEVHVTEGGAHVWKSGNGSSYTLTTTTAISTSNDKGYDGPDADVYFGTSNNTVYGKMRSVGLYLNDDGQPVIDVQEKIGFGSEFATTFAYSQYEILHRVIPQLDEAIKSLLTYDADYKPGTGYHREVSGEPLYVTSLREGDKGYGSRNTDKAVWGDAASEDPNEGPSFKMIVPADAPEEAVFPNQVHNYAESIYHWQDAIRQNEKAKVEAINSPDCIPTNISIGTGTTYTGSQEVAYSKSDTSSEDGSEGYFTLDFKSGFCWNRVGWVQTAGTTVNSSTITEIVKTDTDTKKFSYTIKPNNRDRLSVDVYNLIKKKETDHPSEGQRITPYVGSPIFVTRAGVTHDPYEGEKKTLFYEPGTTIMFATMQMEKPELVITNPHLTGLAPGSDAVFECRLRNLSESNDTVKYTFNYAAKSNVNKADVSMDGYQFKGMDINIPPKGEVVRYLTLRQTDLSEQTLHLQVSLSSTGQIDALSPVGRLADVKEITAEYLPTSSPITLTTSQQAVNIGSAGKLAVKFKDYSRNFTSFKRVRLYCKYENSNEPELIKEWAINGPAEQLDTVPPGNDFSYDLDMSNAIFFPDGNYKVFARTVAIVGDKEVVCESEPIAVVKDMTRPAVLGHPSPKDFVIGRNDLIEMPFSEAIAQGKVTKDNIIVRGRLNGAPVDHATAMQFTGTEESPETEASFSLHNHDFTGECWCYLVRPDKEATIFSHGIPENGFAINVDAAGHLILRAPGLYLASEQTIDWERWSYLSCNYVNGEGDAPCYFNAQIATDAGTKQLFVNQPVEHYDANGPLRVGANLKGAMHELAFWNTARTMEESQSQMHTTKSKFTPGLVGYWPMDEGYGNTASEAIHGYDIKSPYINWYTNTPGKAMHLDGTGAFAVDMVEAGIGDYDDYAVEMWLRGAPQRDVTLLSWGNDKFSLDTDEQGVLTLITRGQRQPLADCKLLDDQWHHFAFNMHRSGSTYVYVDGQEKATLLSANMPPLAAARLVVGAYAELADSGRTVYSRHFEGDIDELRVWRGSLSAKYIAQHRTERADTLSAEGLVAYYPFEQTRTGITSFTTDDMSRLHAAAPTGSGYGEAEMAAGLKPTPEEAVLDFDFSTSDKSVLLSLSDDLSRLHGNNVSVTLRDITDLNDNAMTTANWDFYVDARAMEWTTDKADLFVYSDQSSGFENVTFRNMTAQTVAWSLRDIPSWLEVSETSGRLSPLGTATLTLNVKAPIPSSSVTEALYLYDSDGIVYPLGVQLHVYQDQPNWAFDPSAYNANMNVVGKVKVDGIVNDNSTSQLVAVCKDKIVGMAHPTYNRRYDTYLVELTVYGDAKANAQDPITFKFWDARTGAIYPVLEVDTAIVFVPNAFYGSYTKPVIFSTTHKQEQTLNLESEWSWISLFVKPGVQKMCDVFAPVATSVTQIKGANDFDLTINGRLTSHLAAAIGQMYMVRVNQPTHLDIVGEGINPQQEPLTIEPGWNWIGFNYYENNSLMRAFADLQPLNGDIIKGQHAFAIYNEDWDGPLTQLQPGLGYMYKSVSSTSRTFCYPTVERSDNRLLLPPVAAMPEPEDYHFLPVSYTKYPGNMTMLAQVMMDGTLRDDVEVGVFAGDECREAAWSDGGYYFLTIPGEQTEPLTFRVYDGISEYVAATSEPCYYYADEHYGTPEAPFIISVTTEEGISSSAVADGVRIYPTRVSSRLHVRDSREAALTVQLYTTGGALVGTYQADAGRLDIDCGSLIQGIYIVKVATADGRMQTKHIVRL